jgi:hypothetical protein
MKTINSTIGIGAATVAVLLAGCGGHARTTTRIDVPGARAGSRTVIIGAHSVGSARAAGQRPSRPSMLAFAECMRSHGVPDFPDPRPPGQIPRGNAFEPAATGGFTANPNSPAYQAASTDCRSLADASPVTPGSVNRVMASQLRFAVCMRAHGVTNFPDPTSTGEIGDNGAISGVNQNAPAYRAAEDTCRHVLALPLLPDSGPPAASGQGG